MPPYSYKKGFTLVELSIVIVIIGLIVAGVSAGQTIVKQAQLRSIITDIDKYKTAINTFKLQYNFMPGDLPTASSYWPSLAGLNGNGNRFIDYNGVVGEDFEVWSELSLAGMVAGSYSGIGPNYISGVNIPKGPFANSAYQVLSQYGAGAIYGRGQNDNGIRFGGITGSNANLGTISGVNAAAIDTKLDDGNASRGNIVAAINNFGAADGVKCVTAAYTVSAGSSSYITTDNNDKSCVMEWWIGK